MEQRGLGKVASPVRACGRTDAHRTSGAALGQLDFRIPVRLRVGVAALALLLSAAALAPTAAGANRQDPAIDSDEFASGTSAAAADASDRRPMGPESKAFTFACADPADQVCAQAWKAAYIAYVDPICQSFLAPTMDAAKAYSRNFKEWVRRLSKGTLKAWVKQTQKTARSLRQYNQLHASLTQQIAQVLPHPNDVATINAWLDHRNRADANSKAAASSFSKFKFAAFRKQLRRANKADDAAIASISGFGFQVCGVSI